MDYPKAQNGMDMGLRCQAKLLPGRVPSASSGAIREGMVEGEDKMSDNGEFWITVELYDDQKTDLTEILKKTVDDLLYKEMGFASDTFFISVSKVK